MSHVEELTFGLADGDLPTAEAEVLATILDTDPAARRIHLSALTVEAVLRGRRLHLGIAPAVIARLADERRSRVAREVMRRIEGLDRPKPRPLAASRHRRALRWVAGTVAVGSVALAAGTLWRDRGKPDRPTAPLRERREDDTVKPPRIRPPSREIATPIFSPASPPERDVAGPTGPSEVFFFDFEDGVLPPVVRAEIVPGPLRPNNRYCAIGTWNVSAPRAAAWAVTITGRPLFVFSKGHVLSFDYWVGREIARLAVLVGSTARPMKYAAWVRTPARDSWGHAEVLLGDLKYDGKDPLDRPKGGERIEEIRITGGRFGGMPLYIDNVRVVRHPATPDQP